MVTRIGHVALCVTDLDRSVSFAKDILGLRESERREGISYLTCNERHHELMLIASARAGCDHLALEVRDEDALSEARDRLVAEGVAVVEDSDEEGIDKALRFCAPGGHVFELFTGMRYDQPAAYDTVAVRPRRFGHFTLKSQDVSELESFLARVLGFRLSDRMGETLVWMRCNSDHHGIGLAGGTDCLHHYAFELESWSTIEQVSDHLRTHGMLLIYGPGRHGPGNNLFSYFLDPEGGVVEYFADLQRVEDDARWVAKDWPVDPVTINQWGPPPPEDFLDYETPYVEASGVSQQGKERLCPS